MSNRCNQFMFVEKHYGLKTRVSEASFGNYIFGIYKTMELLRKRLHKLRIFFGSNEMPEDIGDTQSEKEVISKFILQSVKKQVPLDDVFKKIECRNDNALSAKERTFIERTYIENVFQEFLNESLFHLKKNIEDIRCNINSLLDDFKQENKIPKNFHEVKHFEMLSNHCSKLSTHERKKFWKTLKSECFKLLESEIRSLNAEIDLVNETKHAIIKKRLCPSLVNEDAMQECLKLL